MIESRRIFAIDVLRGIAISIVIYGHALQRVHGFYPPYHPVHQIILCFQMELFFAIAGYVSFMSPDGSVWQSLGKKAKRLLVPYFTWVTLSLVICFLKGNVHFDLLTLGRYYLRHPFWFLRTMFYVCAIHIMARKVYSLDSFRHSFALRAIASATVVLILSVFARYVLRDAVLPWYLVWFYIGFGIGTFIKLDNKSKAQSRLGSFIALCGRESLALYALHWWLFFFMVLLPIPTWSRCPEVLCALIIAFVWLFVSLCLDLIVSRVPLAAEMLLGKSKRIIV